MNSAKIAIVAILSLASACSDTKSQQSTENSKKHHASITFSEINISRAFLSEFLKNKVIVTGPTFWEVYYDNGEWAGFFADINLRIEHGKWKLGEADGGATGICIDLDNDKSLPATMTGYICREVHVGANPNYIQLQDLFSKDIGLVEVYKVSEYQGGIYDR